MIFKNLVPAYKNLCFCQFGNYLIQHLIEKGSEKEYVQIVKQILYDNFVQMSNN